MPPVAHGFIGTCVQGAQGGDVRKIKEDEMEITVGESYKGTSGAYLLIKTELGQATEVARKLSENRNVLYTVVVTGPYDVVAAVRVSDNEALADLVVGQVHIIPGIKNPITLVRTKIYKDGEPAPDRPIDGPP